MSWLRTFLLCFAVAIVFAGCGGGVTPVTPTDDGGTDAANPMPEVDANAADRTTPPDPGSVTPEQACETYWDAYCKLSDTCTPYLAKWLDGTVEECKAKTRFGCIARFRAPGNTETPASYVACAQAIQGMSCDEYVVQNKWPAACDVPPGTLADGTACLSAYQCQGGNCKKPDKMRSTYLCGTCAPVSKPGGPCTTLYDCEGYISCSQGVCTPLVPLGGVCDADHVCDGFLVCVGMSSTVATGTCGKPLGLGAPCDPDSIYDVCDYFIAGLSCSRATRSCAARTLVGPGQICQTDAAEAFLDCASGLHCDPDSLGRYTCVSGTPEGASCTTPYECSASHKCFNGVCVPLDPSLCH